MLVESPESQSWRRRALAAILLASLVLNTVGLNWGLPNGNQTWAADALQPVTPMAVGRHVLFGDGWNSGWFYFKYPVGHPLVVLAAQLPYVAWMFVTGEMRKPVSQYPYGFKHPETSLARLALLSRVVSALLGVGLVWLAFLTGSLLFGGGPGLLSAVCVAGCYPFVFYAHTSNVDLPLLFWIAAALAATLWSAERDSRVATALVGVAAAMALLTKEQSIGALAALPVVWVIQRVGRRPLSVRSLAAHAATAALAFAAVTILVSNVAWNPTGYLNRWRFLLGTLPQEVREKYAPYQFMVQVPKEFSLSREAQKLGKVATVLAQGLTPPLALLSVVGLLWSTWRRPRAALILLAGATAYYVLSLRALELVPVRYVMPLLYLAILAAGAAVLPAVQMTRSLSSSAAGAVRLAAAIVLAAALLPGVDVARLLVRDPRYSAESWLDEHAGAATRIEVYQPATYLPRFDKRWTVTRVPVAERSIEAFGQRQPDFVVMSGGGRAGLTGRYAKNWQPGQAVFSDSDAAKQFLDELRAERLGYRRVIEFKTEPWFVTPRINSLSPTITIYARTQGS